MTINITPSLPPHRSERMLTSGNTLKPKRALILVHGRGASAEDIMNVVPLLEPDDAVLVLAPQAAHRTWYPGRFMEPQTRNQPFLEAALERIHAIISFLHSEYSLTPNHIALAGFSQGACLVSEYLKQHPRHYLAAAIWSGGLIGSRDEIITDVTGSLSHTPVYLGCDETDFHIPAERVMMTADYLEKHEAIVTLRFYQNLGHTIHPEGIDFLASHLNTQ